MRGRLEAWLPDRIDIDAEICVSLTGMLRHFIAEEEHFPVFRACYLSITTLRDMLFHHLKRMDQGPTSKSSLAAIIENLNASLHPFSEIDGLQYYTDFMDCGDLQRNLKIDMLDLCVKI
jgi:hypothetical protein